MKLRIVELIHDSSSIVNRKREFVIQRRGLLWWRQVYQTEVSNKEITFKSYDEAEEYLLRNYTGHGRCERVGCVYYYESYSYGY